MENLTFIPLGSNPNLDAREYRDLIKVKNSTGEMLRVTGSHYLLAKCFALVDPNDSRVKNLLDKRKLVIVSLSPDSSQPHNSITGQDDSSIKNKKKNKAKRISEQKKKITELGDLFE